MLVGIARWCSGIFGCSVVAVIFMSKDILTLIHKETINKIAFNVNKEASFSPIDFSLSSLSVPSSVCVVAG